MVIGLCQDEAMEVGRELGQNAIVLGFLGLAAEVRWVGT